MPLETYEQRYEMFVVSSEDCANIKSIQSFHSSHTELEDLKVLRRSPDLLNNVKNRSRSTTACNGTNFLLPYIRVAAILVK